MYAVQVTQNGGCMATSVCVNVINIGIGEETTPKAEVNLYPNPTRGQLTMDISGVEIQNERIQIRTMTGSLVEERIISTNKVQLDLSTYDDGIYFIQIGEVVKKVIVTK